MNKLHAALCLLLAVAHAGSALECYTCTTVNDPNCGTPFLGEMIDTLTCTENGPSILKAHPKYKNTRQEAPLCVTYTGSDDTGTEYTVRSCSTLGQNTCAIIEESAAAEGAVVSACEVCDVPLCNSASSLHGTVLVVAALALAMKALLA